MALNQLRKDALFSCILHAVRGMPPAQQQFHLFLAQGFDEAAGTTTILNKDLAAGTGVSLRTVSYLKKHALESGLWKTSRGFRGRASVYAPTDQLVSLLQKNEGHQ